MKSLELKRKHLKVCIDRNPIPGTAAKVKYFKVSLYNEIFVPVLATWKMDEDEITRKNCLNLIVKNLNKTQTEKQLKDGIRASMGSGNVVEAFFKKEHGRHLGTCNVECLNAAVYK